MAVKEMVQFKPWVRQISASEVAARKAAARAAIARSVDLVAASQRLVDGVRSEWPPDRRVSHYAYLHAELDNLPVSALVRRDGSMCGHRQWLRLAKGPISSSGPAVAVHASIDPLLNVVSLTRTCDRLDSVRLLDAADRGVYPQCGAVASIAGQRATQPSTRAEARPAAPTAMEAETFDSQDVGQIEAFVSKIYSKLHIGAVGETTRAQIVRRVLSPEVGFDELDYSFDIGYAGEAQRLLIICDVISNAIRRDSDNDGEQASEIFGPGDQFVISRPDLPYSGLCHAARLRFTLVDPALLTRAAMSDSDPEDSVRVLDHRPVSRQAALQLQRNVAYVRDHVMTDTGPDPTPLVISTASQFLAASVLQTYPNSAVALPTRQDHHDAQPDALHLAVAFIEANPDLDITIGDIARAAYVTPRAIQLAFRKHLGTTPMAYLRRVRLDCAHQQLQAGGEGLTVTAVACRWGFFSPSRFARYYRMVYGTEPSHTLRSGR